VARGKKKSNVEKALTTVKIEERGLSKYTEPGRTWQVVARRVRKRNSIIYKEWLDAEDKETAIDLLQEKWGFKRRGDVLRIIEKMKTEGAVIPAMAAETKVLRRVKTEEVLRDYDAQRAELDLQLLKLRKRRAMGEKTIKVEIVETVSDKNGAKDKTGEGAPTKKVLYETKTKLVFIDAEIRHLEAERAKSHTPEAAALADYTVKERDRSENITDIAARANAVFVSEYQRQSQMNRDNEIPANAEVVDG